MIILYSKHYFDRATVLYSCNCVFNIYTQCTSKDTQYRCGVDAAHTTPSFAANAQHSVVPCEQQKLEPNYHFTREMEFD